MGNLLVVLFALLVHLPSFYPTLSQEDSIIRASDQVKSRRYLQEEAIKSWGSSPYPPSPRPSLSWQFCVSHSSCIFLELRHPLKRLSSFLFCIFPISYRKETLQHFWLSLGSATPFLPFVPTETRASWHCWSLDSLPSSFSHFPSYPFIWG